MPPVPPPASAPPDFSLCLPSNRPLAEAKPTFLSALAVLERGHGELIVSDNSGDPEKATWLEALAAQHPGRLRVFVVPGLGARANWDTCIDAARGRFLGVLSDDDLLHVMGPLSFDHPPEVVAIKPHIVGWDPTAGIAFANTYPLPGETALERLSEYARRSAGNNTTFYSFLRAEVFRSVWDLCGESHPTQGSYVDWAQVFAWVSSGRYVSEPNWLMVYCNRNWTGDSDAIAQTVARQYLAAGLPEGLIPFREALNALDTYLLVARHTSPVGVAERFEAATWVLNTLVRPLVERAMLTPEAQPAPEQRLLERFVMALDRESLLNAILRLLDHFDPALAQRYLAYHELAIGAPWGERPG